MAHLLTVSNETGGVTCTTASFTVPATATYCTVMAYMRGSDGGETTLVSAEVGGQSVTLDNSLYRQFDVFQAVEGGYILSADMPSGSVTASATRTSAQGGFGITVCFFDDAAQQAPVASKDGDGSGGDPFNTNLTMPTAGVIVDGIVTSNTGVTFTTNQTDQTQRATESGGSVNLFTSTRVVGSGSQTMGWDTQANGDRTSHLLFGLEESGVATPTIDTNDDPIRLGTTSSHTVSDFGGPITSAIISRDGISVAATSVSDTQATWPALAQNLVIPACGTGATLTLSDGTDTADVTIEFLPEAGFTWRNVLTVSGSLIEGDWGFGLGLESNQDGYITRDSDAGIATHNDDGSTTWLDYGTSLVYSRDKNAIVGDDGGLTSITLNNLENGPLLTLPTGTATGQTTASGTVTTDEGNGTLYYLASVNASESSGTIKAGSSQAVTATGVQNVTVTGLTASTNYYLHYVQTNTLLEDSNVASSAQFTTLDPIPPESTDTRQTTLSISKTRIGL